MRPPSGDAAWRRTRPRRPCSGRGGGTAPSGEAAERTWITAIALNVCRDLLRSPWHTRRMELSALAEPSAEDAPWDDTPLRAVLSLPRKYREVVLLRYYEEFTLEEIADTLGIAPGTVSARLTQAKRKLRPMLEEWYYD
ncbi:MAG: sigma-70 family RNA polymerase sigma factor [Flavonifractor plautii]